MPLVIGLGDKFEWHDPLGWLGGQQASKPADLPKNAPTAPPQPKRSTFNDVDRNDLINTVIAEAAGEGDEGMAGVASVIRNRANERGLSPGDVVRQPKQFTGYEAPGRDAKAAQQDPAMRARAESIIDGVFSGNISDPTDGADHYHADSVSPDWAAAMPKTTKIGRHQYYRAGGKPNSAQTAFAPGLSGGYEDPFQAILNPSPDKKPALPTFDEAANSQSGARDIAFTPSSAGDPVTKGGDPDGKGFARLLPKEPDFPSGKGGVLNFVHAGQNKLSPAFESVLMDTSRELGRDFTVLSGFRDPSHPVEAAKAEPGEHSKGDAADISMKGMDDGERAGLVRNLLDRGAKRFITYSGSPDMLHVDMKDQAGDGRPWFMFDRTNRLLNKAPQWFQDVAAAPARAPVNGDAVAGKPENSIVIDENFQSRDDLGWMSGENPFTAEVGQERARADAQRTAVADQFEQTRIDALNERHNATVDARQQELNADAPDRYQTIDESELLEWQKTWDAENKSEGLAGDTGRILKAGTIALGQQLSSLADTLFNKVPGGKEFLQASDDIDRWAMGKTLDQKMASSIDQARASVTDRQQEADAKNWWNSEKGTFGPAWSDPRSYLRTVGESVPSTVVTMAPGGILARGSYLRAIAGGASQRAAAAAAARTAALSGALTEGTLGGADSAKNVRDRIAALPREQILQSDAVKDLIGQGMTEDEAIKAVTEDAATQAFVTAGVVTGSFGGMGDRVLAKIIAEGVGGSIAKRIATGLAKGFIGEGLLEEAPQGAGQQIAENAAVQTVDPNQSLTEGVGEQVAAGIAAGGAMGGALGGVGGAMSPAAHGTSAPASAPEVETQPAPAPTPQPRGPVGRAVQHAGEQIQRRGQEQEAAAAAAAPPVSVPENNTADASLGSAPAAVTPASTDGRPGIGATVRVEADGIEPFMASIDGYEGDEAVVIDRGSGEIYQVPIGNITQIARSPEEIERENPTDTKPGPINDSIPALSNDPALEPQPPIGSEIKTEPLPPQTDTQPATERLRGKPAPGQRVIVDDPAGGRFAARVDSYQDGDEALVVNDDGEALQVPVKSLYVDKLTPKQVEQQDLKRNPPIEREVADAGPNSRKVMGKTVVLPDDDHAALYDLAMARRVAKKLGGAAHTDLERVGADEVNRLAEKFKVSKVALTSMAEDYGYRVSRAAKEARSTLPTKMHPVNETRLRQWQRENAKLNAPAASEDTAAVPNFADWWDLTLDDLARRKVLDEAGVKRSERSKWASFTPAIRKKLEARHQVHPSAGKPKDVTPIPNVAPPAPADDDLFADTRFPDDADAAAHQAATSPANDLPEPSQAQKEAGNYQLGHVRLGGLDISIENPAGSERSGVDGKGKPWSVEMKSHYGYVRKTEGADGDHIDVFVKPGTAELTGDSPVTVIDQSVPGGAEWDEHKVMLGFDDMEDARKGYLANYTKGWKGIGNMRQTTLAEFKEWLKNGDTSKPFAEYEASDEASPRPAEESSRRPSELEGDRETASTQPRAAVDIARDGAEVQPERFPNIADQKPISFGPGARVAPRPIAPGEALYRETDANGLYDLLSHEDAADVANMFVANRPELAIGQGMNKGVHIAFRPDSLGGREHQKPGLAATGGKEFVADMVAPRAVAVVTMPEKTVKSLRPLVRQVLSKEFTRRDNDGIVTFTRNGIDQSSFDNALGLAEDTEGPFGPILHGYEGNWRDAALELERRQSGDAIGALNHPEVGPIDLVWGKAGSNRNDGYGLAKLLAWHPDALRDLQGLLDGMQVVSRSDNRIQLADKGKSKAGVRLDWDGKTKHWLISAFFEGERRSERSTDRLTDIWKDASSSPPPEGNIAPEGSEVQPPGGLEEDSGKRPDPKITGSANDLKEVDPPSRTAGDTLQTWALDAVWHAGRQTGHEYLAAIDDDGTVAFYGTANRVNSTGINDSLLSAMANPDRRLAIFHNHPKNGPLSIGDISMLSLPGIHSVWAIGHIGSKHRGALTAEARAALVGGEDPLGEISKLERMLTAARDTVDRFIRPLHTSGGITSRQAADAYRNAPSILAERANIIDLSSSVVYHPSDIEGLEKALDDAARALNKEFFNGREVSGDTRVRGPAGRVGHAAELEGLGAGVERVAGDRSATEGLSEGSPRNDQAEVWRDVDRELGETKATPSNIIGAVGHAIDSKFIDFQPHLLATVPLNYFPELAGGRIPAIDDYLLVKRKMDAYRGTKHDEAVKVIDQWRKLISTGFLGTDKTRAAQIADLMHDTTLSGVDPSVTTEEEQKKAGYQQFRRRYLELPRNGQSLYQTVRDAYRKQADETDQLLLDNVRKAQQIALDQAEERYKAQLAEIAEKDMNPIDRRRAVEEAESKYKADSTKSKWAAKARMTRLRQQFESTRVEAPYFPLARFGRYFTVAKDIDGKVLHFSRHESKADMDAAVKSLQRELPNAKIGNGVLEEGGEVRKAMDPRVVAEIETMLAASGVSDDIRDALYQRYLETMPDLSMRKRFIHRKGTAGYNRDAFRVFASTMFHGAHQMARLKYGLELQENVNRAVDQAQSQDDNTRDMTLVNELQKRDKWVRNPTGAAFTNWLTSIAYVWYMGLSPAAALVNASQTVMLGVPLLGAKFGIGKSSAALLAASKDFARGRGDIRRGVLSSDERAAMNAFLESGLIDRTQSHDLAAVGETGTKYNPVRNKVMNIISWGFHKVEVMNREITALAAYRLARNAGQGHLEAINTAHERTYAIHFDMSNSSRPRLMQSDFAKTALMFRSYQINMLYRLFRDVHQSVKGESPAVRREARIQLAGITGMMALLAGATGTVGYGFLMTAASLLAGVFGDDDDPFTVEDRFKAGVIDTLGPELGGIVLNGLPGHYLGIDLTSRIGMPDLWFRSPNRDLQGREAWQYWVLNSLGASVSLGGDMFEGFRVATDENSIARGLETAAPKAVRDLMKTWRYAWEGVKSRNGDEVLPAREISYRDLAAQALGFTPAKVAETYDRNSALINAEKKITDERRRVMNAFAKAVENGDDSARKEALAEIKKFNQVPAHRPVAITSKSLKQSLAARARNRNKKVDGVLIQNEKLGGSLRKELPQAVYR